MSVNIRNISPEINLNPPDLNEGHPSMYALGATVTVLSTAAYIGAFFYTFPLAASIQIVALGVLTAVSYGIINDQIACRQCIHYFTVGHTTIHKRLLKTENPTLNAFVWGIHASWNLGLLAGVVLAVSARASKLVALNALSMTPIAILLVIGTCTYAHIQSKKMEKEWSKPEYQDLLNHDFDERVIVPKKGYHAVNLSRIPEDKRAAFFGVAKRNEIGYKVLPKAGVILTISCIALRIFLTLSMV